ncbi:hypothetical protein D3C86_2214130 [compost metagenome]
MKRRADLRAFDALAREALRPTLTPFEQMVREIARHGLGLLVVATLALCMLALALADVPGGRP